MTTRIPILRMGRTLLVTIQVDLQDQTAMALCNEHALPIVIFDMAGADAVYRAIRGDEIGSLVTSGDPSARTLV